MSTLFSTVVIFTIGLVCSPVVIQTTSGSTVVDIPGFSHGLGRCKEMVDCHNHNGMNWDSRQGRRAGEVFSRAMCTLQDCHKLCIEANCKAFEYYKIPSLFSRSRYYYCTIYPIDHRRVVGYCHGQLIDDSGPSRSPFITYRRTGIGSNISSSLSVTTAPGSCGNKSLTGSQVVGLVPKKCRCEIAQSWARLEYHSTKKDKDTVEQQIRNLKESENHTRNRAINSTVPDQANGICLKTIHTDKKKAFAAAKQVFNLMFTLC